MRGCSREGRPKDCSGPWSIQASVVDGRKVVWEHVTMPKWKFGCRNLSNHTALLDLSVMRGRKTLAASKEMPFKALLTQNCHFLYHVHQMQLCFVDLWQSEYSVVYSMSTHFSSILNTYCNYPKIVSAVINSRFLAINSCKSGKQQH